MGSAKALGQRMTASEYVAWEREQSVRHEYFAGEVFAQAGGTRRHSLVGSNVLGELRQLLKGHECQAHSSDMRIHIEATGYQAYPDVSVVCPPIEGASQEVISNPILIVEVLSPSTEDFDRGGKFGHYRQIPTLREYLVFWQDQARVEQHTRNSQDLWTLREIVGIDQVLQLASLGQRLALRDAYDKVKFPSKET